MANRPYFVATPDDDKNTYREYRVDFGFFSGFSTTQKRKSIQSLHNAIIKQDGGLKILEVSRKSETPLGVQLSAFNLTLYDYELGMNIPIECIYQSSKVFENGGPYRDLLLKRPTEAKKDERLKNSGNLIAFNYNHINYPLIPITLFYDWVYISALKRSVQLSEQLVMYDAFTDIEFNPLRSINCQARATAIYVSLQRSGRLEESLTSISTFSKIYDVANNP